ncbi:MAG: MTH1187 family thiamine-binding protein [Desulfobacterota bacterium]|nr:MTH1187 family thiamine-binding protein [Thermodesulfobacteriota bacterium]
MLLVELSMFPIDKGESLSPYVSRVLEVIDKSGLHYKLNSMGTVIEGEWEEVMELVKKCHQELEKDCNRISTLIKIDYRKGNISRIEAKIKAVEKILGRSLMKQG